MTYELVKTDIDTFYLDGTIQYIYIFKNKLNFRTRHVNYNKEANKIESMVYSASCENFQYRKHCIPKVVDQFIDELKLAAIL